MKSSFSHDKMNLPILALVVLLMITFLGLSIASIFRNKNNYMNESRIKSKTQAQLLGENTAGLIYTVDFALLSIRSMIEQHSSDGSAPQSFVFDFVRSEIKYLPQIQDIFFLNSKGEVDYSTEESKRLKLASFEEHRDAWLDFAFESVIQGKKEASLLLSRRVEKQNGQFIGVLVAAIDPKFFYDRYDNYLNIDANAIVLFDNNGSILAHWLNHSGLQENIIESAIPSIPQFSSLFNTTMINGGLKTREDKTAIFSTYQLRGFPYTVAVLHSKKEILEKWNQETRRDLSIIAVTLITAICTIALAFRQRQGRKKAESRLFEHQLNLEETVRKRTEQLDRINLTLANKNADIEKALMEIKTLKGIVPICCFCKNIRDDKGYWEQLEIYVSRHTHADFSHGICPECMEKHYPDLEEEKD